MVHVEKDYTTPPNALTDSKWNDLKKSVLSEKNNHKAKSECYRDTTLDSLVVLYSGKCACCERSFGYELQVDHYRPKKARQYKNKTYNHSGYYWLTYEWSNLIPLCSSCNQSKSNYFPLKNKSKRVSSHTHKDAYNPKQLYSLEQPLLINPEIELYPEKYFKYLPNGKVEGRAEEGKEMVKLYKLNSRTKIRERRIVIEHFRKNIRSAINEYLDSNNKEKESELKGDLKHTFRDIIEKGRKDNEFSLLHLYIRNYFKIFITDYFPVEWQNKLKVLFKEYYYIWKENNT